MCSNAIAPASITGDRKRGFTPISFSLFCVQKPLSQLQHVANVSLYGQSRTCNTWRIRHHETESSKLQTEILTWRILCLSYLSACWHRRQKQNSHCFQCQKASWTTLKDFYLARWPDAIWKKMTLYLFPSFVPQRQLEELFTSYPKPTYSSAACCHTAAAFAPNASGRWEQDLWPAATRQQGIRRGVRGSTAGSSAEHASSRSPRHLPRGRGWLTPWEMKDVAVEEWESGAGGDVLRQGLKFWVIFKIVASLKSTGCADSSLFFSVSTSVEWCLKNVSAKQRVQTWDDNATTEK